MNETNLKKPSETDWARIDEMTDEAIDTSDIPPLGDTFFAAAKWPDAVEGNGGHLDR